MPIALPTIPKDIETIEGLQTLIQKDETLSGASFRNEDISRLRVKSFSADELRLEKIVATEAKLEKTSFSDVELINCDLVATALPEASWRRVLVKNSRCDGLQLQTSTLKDITFLSSR